MTDAVPFSEADQRYPAAESAILREFSIAAGKRNSDRVQLDADYRKDLGIDSIGLISVIASLEETLGISLLECIEELANATRVRDVANIVFCVVKAGNE